MEDNIDYANVYVHYDDVDKMKILIKKGQVFYGLDNMEFAFEVSEPVEGFVSCKINEQSDKISLLYRLVGNGVNLNRKHTTRSVILSVPMVKVSNKERFSFNYFKLMAIGERLFGKNNFIVSESMLEIKKLSKLPDEASLDDLKSFESQYNAFNFKTHNHGNFMKNTESGKSI